MSTMHAPRLQQRPNPWAVAVIALSAALVGLGIWVLVDRSGTEAQPAAALSRGLASERVATMLRNRIVAFNAGDRRAVAAFYAPAGVLEERDVAPAVVTRGSEQIGDRIGGLRQLGLRLKSESPVIQFGRYAVEAVSTPSLDAGWILVYELDANGKIAHQWVIGGSP